MRTLIPIFIALFMLGACGPGGSKSSNTKSSTGTPVEGTSGGSTLTTTNGTTTNGTTAGSTGDGTTDGSANTSANSDSTTGGSETGTTSGDTVVAVMTGSVSGRVTDSDSAHWGSLIPLADVTVKIGDKTVVTGPDGIFTLTDITLGTVSVSATRTDYTAYSAAATVVADETAMHDIPLVFTRAIRIVTGKNGVGGAETNFAMTVPNAITATAPLAFVNHDAWIIPSLGAWIGPENGNLDGAGAGLYKYEYHFQLPEAAASTAYMLGAWDSDNGTVAYVNGVKVVDQEGERGTPFTELNPLPVLGATYFKVGDNKLYFEVDNWADGPTGFYFVGVVRY